jgi:microcystin-dependent protein
MVDNHPSDHNVISAALTEILNHMASMEQTLGPIGGITMWPGDTPPTNALLCQGQAVLRASYPEIFAIFGTRFGAGDGSTTFNLPSMQGRSAMGFWPAGSWATVMGQMLGSADSSLPSHTHLGVDHLHPVNITTGGDSPAHTHAAATFGGFLGSDFSGSATGVTAGGYLANAFPATAGPNQGHTHPVNGYTGAADRGLTTSATGVAPTNTNIGPVVVLNFIMRVH